MYKGKIIDIEIDDEHIYGEVIGETKETSFSAKEINA